MTALILLGPALVLLALIVLGAAYQPPPQCPAHEDLSLIHI